MSNTLLRIYPSDLKMPFELRKQNSGCIELVNKTDQRVAFKVKTTNPRKYSVRPASGIVLPRGSCGITVTMQAPKEIPPDYHCKDKFLVQSIVVEDGTTLKDIVPDMFSKAPGKIVEEFKLRVVYVPANPPSPVPEEAEEENESFDSDVDQAVERPSTPNADVSMIRKSEEEESRYGDENKKLQEELELLRKRVPSRAGFSAAFVLLVFLLSLLVGYLMLESKA
ncbi:vesicle-associated protein 1-3-like isoform X2 [Phragmites australis]|uniref:vesicle-associated protein 1-3-like isoform X2 n=1 Tax=Phragmites australis TaxID=29695 RepID=UPI002D780D45|nr:vesicle-associated protein 1-3-like isoform X2 [Phragmites australis]